MTYSHTDARELEDAFARYGRYIGYALSGMMVYSLVKDEPAKAVAYGALAWGLQQLLQTGHFVGEGGVVKEAASIVQTGEAAPEVIEAVEAVPLIGGPPRGNTLVQPAVSQPVTIAVPKPKPPLPPWAPPDAGNVPYFREAAADIISRQPVAIQDPLRRTAEGVGRLYREDHVFALAKSSDIAVTKRVQDIVARGITEGLSVDEAVDRIREVNAGWTRAYAETVYRTNLATARTQGRFMQAARPGMEKIAPLMVFRTAGDNRVRPNHAAADGAAAPPSDFMWDVIAPPLGYNCRCQVLLVSWEMGYRMGLITPGGEVLRRAPRHGAGTDPGFVHTGRSRWAA